MKKNMNKFSDEKLEQFIDGLFEKERLFAEFFFHSDLLNAIVNEEGYFEYVSPMWVELSGYSAEELCSKPIWEFIHPDDVMSSEEAWQERATLATGIPPGKVFVNRYKMKDGKGYFPVRWYNPTVDSKKKYWLCPAYPGKISDFTNTTRFIDVR